MASYADEIIRFENERCSEERCSSSPYFDSIASYAKGLEFALECIGKGVRMPTCQELKDEMPKYQYSPAAHISKTPPHAAINCNKLGCPECGGPQLKFDPGSFTSVAIDAIDPDKEPIYNEAKSLDIEHFFKDFGPENPCGKPLCSVCYPKARP